jgi:NAD(P)-dependent dehydrogenase (short-subunit alcohol dehydrogenase family)
MKLKNKIAIVTGGNSGIGKGIAKAFAKEGAKIAIVDIHRQKGDAAIAEIRTLGSEAIFVPGDVSELEDTKNYIRQTLEAFGRIDIMVNNAAVIHQARIVDLAEDDWDRVIKNNLRSVFLGSKYAALEMIKQGGGGRIINISSIHAVLSEPQAGHYSASKGAINAFTRTLASELAPHKITANVLQPGATYTELTTPMYTPNVKEALFKRVPLRAIANVEDIACGAVFMASDEAWYMTGSSITIDGGYVMDGSLPDAEYWSEN